MGRQERVGKFRFTDFASSSLCQPHLSIAAEKDWLVGHNSDSLDEKECFLDMILLLALDQQKHKQFDQLMKCIQCLPRPKEGELFLLAFFVLSFIFHAKDLQIAIIIIFESPGIICREFKEGTSTPSSTSTAATLPMPGFSYLVSSSSW